MRAGWLCQQGNGSICHARGRSPGRRQRDQRGWVVAGGRTRPGAPAVGRHRPGTGDAAEERGPAHPYPGRSRGRAVHAYQQVRIQRRAAVRTGRRGPVPGGGPDCLRHRVPRSGNHLRPARFGARADHRSRRVGHRRGWRSRRCRTPAPRRAVCRRLPSRRPGVRVAHPPPAPVGHGDLGHPGLLPGRPGHPARNTAGYDRPRVRDR